MRNSGGGGGGWSGEKCCLDGGCDRNWILRGLGERRREEGEKLKGENAKQLDGEREGC